MADVLDLMSRRIVVAYITDEGCATVNSRGLLSVEPITARSSRITWRNLPLNDSNERFYIQKSGSPNSGWVTLGTATTLDNSFLDDSANNTMNRHDVEYYRILAPTSLVVIGVAKVEGDIDPYGAEMARRHSILLHKGRSGNKSYAFIRMRSGTPCPECWDEILQQRSKSDCRVCNDTGYVSGYYNPIELYISFDAEPVAVQNSIDGPDTAPDTISAWTSNFPLLNIGDVILESKGNRFWEVQQINLTMHKRVVTKQQLVLAKQEGDDPLLALINRVPKEVAYGQGVFQDDSANS